METNGVALLSMAAELSQDVTHTSGNTSGGMPTELTGDSTCSSSSPRKLTLPEMTPDVKQDLESGRLSSADLPLSIAKRQEWLDYPLKDIAQPHSNDVLCGRGGGSNNHPGNEAFRLLVAEVKLPYVNCAKREKPLIARRVVEAVRAQSPPGRFLQKDANTGLWNDIGDGRAREKTSQALREGAPVIRGMIDKNGGEVASFAKKKTKTLSENVVEEKRAVDSTLDVSEVAKAAQIPAAKPAYQDYANQSQLPLSLQRLKDRQMMPPSNSHHQSRNVQDHSSNMGMQQWSSFKNVPSYPPQPSLDDLARFAGEYASSMQFPQHRRRATMDYAPPHLRHAAPDSIPYETVRGLLLGHLDPVQLAYRILSPEDAAAVARLHLNNTSLNASSSTASSTIVNNALVPQPASRNLLPLCSIVSDESSSPSECTKEEQSSDDSSRQSSVQKVRALPKKKRKFIE